MVRLVLWLLGPFLVMVDGLSWAAHTACVWTQAQCCQVVVTSSVVYCIGFDKPGMRAWASCCYHAVHSKHCSGNRSLTVLDE